MAETAGRLRTVPDGPGQAGPDSTGGGGGHVAGRLLDVAGLLAGAFAVLIVADLLSGGKLSGWLIKRGGCKDCPPAPPEGEGLADDS